MEPGDLIARRYRLTGKLGAGELGATFKAVDIALERNAVVKIMAPPSTAPDDGFADRCREAAGGLLRLASPHVVSVYDAGKEENWYWLAMEYLAGADLNNLLASEDRLPLERAALIFRHILHGLQDLHEEGLIHGALRPGNVRVLRGDFAKLLEAGLVRACLPKPRELSATGEAVPAYLSWIAPEQLDGALIPESDLFSVTALFYFLLTGKRPFEGVTVGHQCSLLGEGRAIPLAKLGIEAPPGFQEVLDRGFAKLPSHRFGSAEEYYEALKEVFTPRPAAQRPKEEVLLTPLEAMKGQGAFAPGPSRRTPESLSAYRTEKVEGPIRRLDFAADGGALAYWADKAGVLRLPSLLPYPSRDLQGGSPPVAGYPLPQERAIFQFERFKNLVFSLFDLKTGQQIRSALPSKPVNDVAYEPRKRLLVLSTGYNPTDIQIFQLPNLDLLATVQGNPDEANQQNVFYETLHLFDQGRRVLAASENSLTAIDLEKGTIGKRLKGRFRGRLAFFNPEDTLLALPGPADVTLFETAEWSRVESLPLTNLRQGCFTPDGKYLLLGGALWNATQAPIYVYDAQTRHRVAVDTRHKSDIVYLEFLGDGGLLSLAEDGTLLVREFPRLEPVLSFQTPEPARMASLSANGYWLAVGSGKKGADQEITLLDLVPKVVEKGYQEALWRREDQVKSHETELQRLALEEAEQRKRDQRQALLEAQRSEKKLCLACGTKLGMMEALRGERYCKEHRKEEAPD